MSKPIAKTNKSKSWWAAVYTGLVVDRDGRHYRKMKNAIWLYIYLVLHADRETGWLSRKIGTVHSDTGVSQRTIRAWMKRLKEAGYIEVSFNGRSQNIKITKWKGVGKRQNMATQNGEELPVRLAEGCQAKMVPKPRQTQPESRKWSRLVSSNDIPIYENKFKNKIDRFNQCSSKNDGRNQREDMLARELAEKLNDQAGLSLYRVYAAKYPEYLLRLILGRVLEIPNERIIKSRGALFNHLVQKYGKPKTDYTGS